MMSLFGGCGDDSSAVDSGTGSLDGASSTPDPIPAGICSSYMIQCSDEGISMCVANCETNPTPDLENCGFIACGVEVGLCDNEVSGDEAILACMRRHGWLDQ